MASTSPPDHLVWKKVSVDGRAAIYGEAGEGLPVVFVHGWGLAHRAYKRALKRLVRLGCRVYSPALPGFGGSADLPGDQRSLGGYARWLDGFMAAVGISEPVFLVGHSFGGGVSIKFAADHPERVRTLVLVNSVGGSKSMAERPLWDWGIHFPTDVLPFPQVTRVLPVILQDVMANVVRNPRGLWRVAQLARRVDLTDELEGLKARRLPVVVLWGDQDRIIPRESFDALCAAIGSQGEVVSGNHTWMLADPDSFGEVLTNVVEVARLAREDEERLGPRGRSRAKRDLKSLAAPPADEKPA